MKGSYCGLEGVFLCGSVPILFSSAFGERAGFDIDASYIFPQSVLAAIILVGGGAGDGGVRNGARCEPGLILCSVAITTLLWVGMGSKFLEPNL